MREAWDGGAQDWEGSGMRDNIIGSALEAFVEPKIEGILILRTPGLGGVW